MPNRVSEAFGVSAKKLDAYGVFNGFLDVDSLLYVDPFLLAKTEAPALAETDKTFEEYFEKVLTLLKAVKEPEGPIFNEIVERLTFSEPASAALGYGTTGTSGSGIGEGLATRLAETALKIVEAGIDDPEIFELVGLFQENIGPDRISDMTIDIILDHLLAYNGDCISQLDLPSKKIDIKGRKAILPADQEVGQHTLLVPKDILRALPVAKDWSDVDYVAQHNAQLRAKVNQKIGDTWKRATSSDIPKSQLRKLLLKYPELLEDLLNQYKAKKATGYDFSQDPQGHLLWFEFGQTLAEQFPLEISDQSPKTLDDVYNIVLTMCEKFGDLIENNGAYKLLWANGDLRHERFAQLLFFMVAHLYCEANNLDLSREPNAGRGPVDFKISQGAESKVAVEVKYSKGQVRHGYETQLPEYIKAENADRGIFLVIRTTDTITAVEDALQMRDDAREAGEDPPEIIVVDGRKFIDGEKRPSASKM